MPSNWGNPDRSNVDYMGWNKVMTADRS
jgi:hypothetical protein